MKIHKYIDVSTEIEIELSIEDIVLLWEESEDKKYEVSANISMIYKYLTALPDESINCLSTDSRALIKDALRKQADRF